jgi:hypothetical protein
MYEQRALQQKRAKENIGENEQFELKQRKWAVEN